MTETTNPTQQQDADAGDLPGADLARIALRQAREAAKARGQSGIRKAKRPARTAAARRDGREPTGFAAVLAGLMADRGWDVPAAGGSILDQWSDIAAAVSPNLASHVSAVAFHTDSGQLDLRPDSPAYATQLRLLSTRVIAAANDAAGTQAVRTIRVMTIGATGPASREAAAAPIPAPAPKVPVKTREDASPGFHQALAAHQAATRPSRVDPSIAEAVERQTAAMRVLSLQAFPEPEQAADEPAPIEPALTERRRQADASHTAALRRARTERAAREAGAAAAVPTLPPLGRTA
ncbi:DciA family protein [Streptomyces sp. NPDC006925]|uniref:DciA family protein n=1 Tax=Streptomyces sp. NPDC006925 TaxID=3364768 RepID=UPI0036CB1B10